MPALVVGIHVFSRSVKGVDGRDMGERSDAVLRTAMPGHDERVVFCPKARPALNMRRLASGAGGGNHLKMPPNQ
jgi:hypothetical protein